VNEPISSFMQSWWDAERERVDELERELSTGGFFAVMSRDELTEGRAVWGELTWE
jgi:hypothetical protein